MVAITEGQSCAPDAAGAVGGADRAVPVHERRFVAVAVNALELLRPESDLTRLVEGAGYVDVLLATQEVSVFASTPVGVLAGCSAEISGPATPELADDDLADDDSDDDSDGDGHSDHDDVMAARIAELGIPEFHVHRLGLRGPLGPRSDGDLVAALSELVGFDPEPGVYLLAPALDPGDPSRSALGRAAARIAQVYGIPLLRYRCLQFTVVDA